ARPAELLTVHAGDLLRRGQALAAADLAEQVLDRWQRDGGPTGPEPLAVRLLGVRGDLRADPVRAAQAEGAYRQALAAAGTAERPELVNRARYVLANVLLEQGDPAAAEAVYAEVLAGCEQIGDSYGAARVLLALTHIHLNRGELAVALKTIDRSRAIRAQLGS